MIFRLFLLRIWDWILSEITWCLLLAAGLWQRMALTLGKNSAYFDLFAICCFCFPKLCILFFQILLLWKTADNSFQHIIDVVFSLTLGCSSWMHSTSSKSTIYLHDLRTRYVECLNFPMIPTIMFWWIGLMKHNSVVMKPPCANSWVESLWS